MLWAALRCRFWHTGTIDVRVNGVVTEVCAECGRIRGDRIEPEPLRTVFDRYDPAVQQKALRRNKEANYRWRIS